MRTIFLFCLILFFLSSCSAMSKSSPLYLRNTQYSAAKNIPPLKIPPGMKSDAFTNFYPVSQQHYADNTKNVSIVPPGLYSNP